jgi:hypothetical protein
VTSQARATDSTPSSIRASRGGVQRAMFIELASVA